MTNFEEFNRRRFLAHAGLMAGLAATSGTWLNRAGAFEIPDSAVLISGKAAGLTVYKADPTELETPLALLREHTITPVPLLFVRNNQTLAESMTTKPILEESWKVEIAAGSEKRAMSVAELRKLEQVEHELVLQCSGNGRAFFAREAKAEGAQWRHGAMGNVRFKGVPLRAVLQSLKITVPPDAKFLTAEGRDTPEPSSQGDFEHSLPLRDAFARSFLALELNGEAIPAIHGGPVRLVTPGYYGTMYVKWLSRLRLEAQETTNYHQVPRYRTPREPIAVGSKFDATLDNSDSNWNMRIKSVIFAPLEKDTVPHGAVEIRGVAWNDGQAKIVAVETSLDEGKTWHAAELKAADSPYAWHHWSRKVRLEPGRHQVWSRAIDSLGRTQPLDGKGIWNPNGYAWNGVDRVEVNVT